MKYVAFSITILAAGVAVFALLTIIPLGEDYSFNGDRSGGIMERVPNASIIDREEYVEREGRGTSTVEGAPDPVPEEREHVSEPLTVTESDPPAAEAELTVHGVITWSNIHRGAQGVPTDLEESELLNTVAEIKLDDLFARQYFAHYDAQGGMGVGSIAREAGYEYIVVGENLALGNFENDRVLLQAWMDSPGHRENILKEQYSQIGVAVGKGQYKGQHTWIAVQVFGRPKDECPQVDQGLELEIENTKLRISELDVELEERQQELEEWEDQYSEEYRQAVEEYNALIVEYNTAIENVQEMIEEYNSQVDAFNVCIEAHASEEERGV